MDECRECPDNMGTAADGATWCRHGAPRNKPTQWHLVSKAQRLTGCMFGKRDAEVECDCCMDGDTIGTYYMDNGEAVDWSYCPVCGRLL